MVQQNNAYAMFLEINMNMLYMKKLEVLSEKNNDRYTINYTLRPYTTLKQLHYITPQQSHICSVTLVMAYHSDDQ